ncbi:MAG: hypothetical protein M3P18_12075, partial [Actinomycetota bacterium]|nr:hypothetical protein [Actinomycetota bacterium]
MIWELALSPHVDALMVTVPGFIACTTPAESTVATELSDDVNLIGTSVLAFPTRLSATAVKGKTSVGRAGDLTVIV